jgi:alkylhydroperoxidase family enzyme
MADSDNTPAVQVLTDAEAWACLPKTVGAADQPLPAWARAIALHMPRTAAAMLKLDYAQRTLGPLDPALRAKLRWVIADANRCEYSMVYALSDFYRAIGVEPAPVDAGAFPSHWLETDQEALDFARLLTLSATSIRDDHVERLREHYGDRMVAAMILLAAYGNFQDRIVQGLSLSIEESGPLLPLQIEFVEGTFQVAPLLPEEPRKITFESTGENLFPGDVAANKVGFDGLQLRLEQQRNRVARLPVPAWEDVRLRLPPEMAARPTRIIWNLMTLGYVPELQVPWNIMTRTHWSELPGDRVFEESLFWVQTRELECNYCMGHCEMLLEVAGLDQGEVVRRTSTLAGNDWSMFSPQEQRAFLYARKLTATPWLLTASDYAVLVRDFGERTAMSTFWWLCRGLYMTRVSDGFQLPLERENVF